MHRKYTIFFLLLFMHPAMSLASSYTLNGSVKSLLAGGETFSGEGYWSDLNRIRLDLDVKPAETVIIKTVYDNEAVIGSILNKDEFNAAKEEDNNLLDLTGNVIDTQDIFLRHSLYRLYLSYFEKDVNLTIGRQRIAWGQGRIWSPTDLFNAVSPLRIEAEQRPGVDAVNMEYSLGPLSSFNIVYAAADTNGEDSVGARLKTNISGYDISMMAGKFSEDEVIGFDFAGNIGDSGFRGEGTFTRQKDGEDFPRFVLSWDYNFANSLYLLLEYLYNGGNLGERATPESIARSSGGIATRNINFLATGLGYDITPLIRFDLYDIYDIGRGGFFINPSTRYNIFANLDWIAGAQAFSGDGDSEYSDFPNIYYTSIEWYF